MARLIVLILVAVCYISAQEYGEEKTTSESVRAYTAPRPKFLVFSPKGMKFVMKDDGFSRVVFHGNLNKKIKVTEAGYWSNEARKNKNGKWVYKDREAELKIGDVIYFWINLVKDGVTYRQSNGKWTVTKYNEGINIDQDYVPLNEVLQEPDVQPAPAPAPAATAAPAPLQITPPASQTTTPAPCKPSETVVAGQTFCQQDLIFSEEFNGNTVKGLSNWLAESKFLGEPDYPFNLYMSEPAGILKLEDGALVISPVLLEDYKHEGFIHESLDLSNKCTGQTATTDCKRQASGAYILPPVITGKVTTKNKFNFKFGRVEVRAKLPAGSWLVPEINLEPLQNFYGNSRYESGLMKVAFVKGNDAFAKKLYGGPVLSDTAPYRTLLLSTKIGIKNWNQDFHNYTLIWKPDSLELLVDEESYGKVVPGEGFHESANQHAVPHAGNWLKGTVMAPLDQMFYVSLGLRVGGINDFDDATDKPWRNKGNKATVSFYNAKDEWQPTWYDPTLKVDYVRVYAL